MTVIKQFQGIALQAEKSLNKVPVSLPASQSECSLSQWIPCIASKKGTISIGLFEMAGLMEDPKD